MDTPSDSKDAQPVVTSNSDAVVKLPESKETRPNAGVDDVFDDMEGGDVADGYDPENEHYDEAELDVEVRHMGEDEVDTLDPLDHRNHSITITTKKEKKIIEEISTYIYSSSSSCSCS